MEHQPYIPLLDSIFLAVKRSRQPTDSLDVFKGLISLSIASKILKKCLTDEIIIQMCYKYLKERTLFATSKLKYYIRNNDFGNFEIRRLLACRNLDSNFSSVADVITFHMHSNDGLFVVNTLLPYVTEHASLDFLKQYVDYFATRQLHKKTLADYFTHGQINEKYHGFHPKVLIKALKLANKNDWVDKTEFLFHLTAIFAGLHNTDKVQEMITKVKLAIANKIKLNFEALTHHMVNLYKRKLVDGRGALYAFESLIHVLPENAIKTTEELFALPIEKQPWFHGNLSRTDIRNMFEVLGTHNCFVITFYGSTLYSDQYQWKKERVYTKHIITLLPNYGLKSKDGPIDLHLYEFYLALVANDFEKIKAIASARVLDWEKTNRQPHPITEYLNKVDDVREDIFDWLLERFGPASKVNLLWERRYLPKPLLKFIRRLLPSTPKMSGNLIAQFIEAEVPKTKLQMEQLAWSWDGSNSRLVWTTLFDRYTILCKQNKLISEQKIMTLLAWRYADGESIGFRNLPKELIKVIVDFTEEPPMVATFAYILAKNSQSREIDYKMTPEWFSKNYWRIKFYYANVEKFDWHVAHAVQRALSMQSMRFFREHMDEFPRNANIPKLWKAIFKYGVPNQENYLRLFPMANMLSIEALKTQNRSALEYLIKRDMFAMPSPEKFATSIKPKHKITYDEALELIELIKQQVKKRL